MTDPLEDHEGLDEDELRLDPLEAGMDPPEHWVGADKYGMTHREEATARPLDERLAEEQPAEEPRTDLDVEAEAAAAERGQSADEAGGSSAAAARQD